MKGKMSEVTESSSKSIRNYPSPAEDICEKRNACAGEG